MLAFLVDGEVALEHMEGVLRYLLTVGQYNVEASEKRKIVKRGAKSKRQPYLRLQIFLENGG